MKKGLIISALILVIVIVPACLEVFVSGGHPVRTRNDKNVILAEMPSIALTEEELALKDRLLENPEIASVVRGEGDGVLMLTGAEAVQFLWTYLPQNMQSPDTFMAAQTSEGECYINIEYGSGTARESELSFLEDQVIKSIRIQRGPSFWGSVDRYQSHSNGSILKFETRHYWFGWLRRIWEKEEAFNS